MGGASGTHLGNIHVEFVDKADRKGNSTELVDDPPRGHRHDAGRGDHGAEGRGGTAHRGARHHRALGRRFRTARRASRASSAARSTPCPAWSTCRTTSRTRCPSSSSVSTAHRAALLGLDTDTIGHVPAHGHLRPGSQPVPGRRRRVRHHAPPAGGPAQHAPTCSSRSTSPRRGDRACRSPRSAPWSTQAGAARSSARTRSGW